MLALAARGGLRTAAHAAATRRGGFGRIVFRRRRQRGQLLLVLHPRQDDSAHFRVRCRIRRHLHVRGKDMKYEIAYADGKRETLINVPAYDFNWQTLYKLKQPLAVPKGAKIIVTAHFDNSAKNKSNPDPTKMVRFGEPTYDEMLVGFVDMARPKPADRAVAKLSSQQLDAFVGEYSAGLVKFRIEREGNTLFFVMPNQPALPATPESESKFYFKDAEGAEVTFTKNEQGEVTDLNAVFGQQKIAAKRVGKAAPASENK